MTWYLERWYDGNKIHSRVCAALQPENDVTARCLGQRVQVDEISEEEFIQYQEKGGKGRINAIYPMTWRRRNHS